MCLHAAVCARHTEWNAYSPIPTVRHRDGIISSWLIDQNLDYEYIFVVSVQSRMGVTYANRAFDDVRYVCAFSFSSLIKHIPNNAGEEQPIKRTKSSAHARTHTNT